MEDVKSDLMGRSRRQCPHCSKTLQCRRVLDNYVRFCSNYAAHNAMHATMYDDVKQCKPIPNREESAGVLDEESEHKNFLSE